MPQIEKDVCINNCGNLVSLLVLKLILKGIIKFGPSLEVSGIRILLYFLLISWI